MENQENETQSLENKLSNSEKKLRGLYEKRDALNEEAMFLRNERNTLNDRKRTVVNSIRKLKDTRRAEMDDLRERRDEAVMSHRIQRDKLHAMVQVQKRKREGHARSLKSSRDDSEGRRSRDKNRDPLTEINILNMEIQALSMQYETTALSKKKELETMERIKELKRQIDELEKILPEHQLKQMEHEKKIVARESVREEHEFAHSNVTQLSQKAQFFHDLYIKENDKFKEKMDGIYKKYQDEIDQKEKELIHLSREADRRHKEFMDKKDRADHFHQRAMAHRGDVLLLREERNAIEQKMKALIDEQNKSVSDALDDEEKQEEAAKKALEFLKKGGKISL